MSESLDIELRALRTAVTALRGEIAALRAELADPTGEARAQREWEARQAEEQAYNEETQRRVVAAEAARQLPTAVFYDNRRAPR
jgi:hypothetical protein